MFCTKCGTQLPDDARFCSGCGAPIAQKAATPDPEPVVTRSESVAEQPEPQPVTQETPAPEAVRFNTVGDMGDAQEQPKPKKKKKKTGLIIGIISAALVVILLAVAALFFFVFKKSDVAAVIDAYVDSSGNAYICYADGKAVKISGDVEYAAMTPDRTKIVVAEKEGQLYWTDVKKSEKHKITDLDEDVDIVFGDGFTPLTNRFFVYELDTGDEKAEVFRYEFETKKNISVVYITIDTYLKKSAFSSDAASCGIDEDIAYAVAEDGEIKVLSPDSNKFQKISSYGTDDKVELFGVSTDGKLVAWTKAANGKYSVVVYRDGKEETVFSDNAKTPQITLDNYMEYLQKYVAETYDSSKYKSTEEYGEQVGTDWGKAMLAAGESDFESFCVKKLTEYFKSHVEAPAFNMNISPDGKTFAILGNKMSFCSNGGDISKAVLPAEILDSYEIYTTNARPLYEDERANKAYGYYVQVEETEKADDGSTLYSLYLISFKDGDRSKLITKIKSASFVEEYVIYVDKNNATNIAELDAKRGELDDAEKIGNDIVRIDFVQDYSEYLYYLKANKSKENVYDLYVYDVEEKDVEKIASDVGSSVYVSTDGKQIYYFVDVAVDNDNYVSYGTLKVYDTKEKLSKTVSGDVITWSVTSNLESGDIDAGSMWFAKYQSGSAESYTFDVCYYDSEKISRVIKGLEN